MSKIFNEIFNGIEFNKQHISTIFPNSNPTNAHHHQNRKSIKQNKMKVIALLASSLSLATAFSPSTPLTTSRTSATSLDASIQFIRGLDEKVVPAVKLTRAKDGSSGIATFNFDNPNCFDASTASKGEVTGMFLTDEEGEMSTTEVNARFANGKPQNIEAIYVMKSPAEWDRFMRFMERYAEDNGLGFSKA